MSLIHNIKEIVKDFIIEKYFEYLETENIILIKTEDLKQVIGELYINNAKNVKAEVRRRLKTEMGEEYPNGSVENILLDIFQDRELNINRLVGEISKFQERNFIERDYSLSNNSNNKSLGLNIQIVNGFCEIVSVKPEFPNMEGVEDYKYLYSINGDELRGIKEEIISTIKNHINNGDKEGSKEGSNAIKLGLYYLRE